MRLCTQCEHYLELSQRCNRDSWINPVDGRTIFYDAVQLRFNETKCGQSGKWFSEKNTQALDDLSTIPFGR